MSAVSQTKSPVKFVSFDVVKAAVSLKQVLGHYGIARKLTKSRTIPGQLNGPCPLCETAKKSPFSVNYTSGGWNCFNCHNHGDMFTLVVLKEGVSISEAAVKIAEWFKVRNAEMTPAKGKVLNQSRAV